MLIEQIKLYIATNPEYTALYLILGKIIGALIFFPGTPLTLLAGATLGLFWGSLVSIIGNTLGATLAFLLARFALRDFVRNNLYYKYPKIAEYEKKISKRGLATVLIVRLIPLFPFNVLNYLLGVTNVKTKDYIIGTFIGIIPGTVAFVYFGESLKMLSAINIAAAIFIILTLTYGGKYYDKKYNN